MIHYLKNHLDIHPQKNISSPARSTMTVISGLGRHFLFLCFHCGNWQNAFFVYAMSEFFGTQVFLLATPADAS
jgi:hypothetical protein